MSKEERRGEERRGEERRGEERRDKERKDKGGGAQQKEEKRKSRAE